MAQDFVFAQAKFARSGQRAHCALADGAVYRLGIGAGGCMKFGEQRLVRGGQADDRLGFMAVSVGAGSASGFFAASGQRQQGEAKGECR